MEKQEQDEAQAGDIEYAQAQQTVLRRRLNDLKERLRDAERRWDKQISGLVEKVARAEERIAKFEADNAALLVVFEFSLAGDDQPGVSIAKTLDLLDDEDSDNEEEKPEPM